jgi:topoisomerase-4 subunit A
MRDGTLKVAKVADKVFMGRDIIHIAIWPKDGDTHYYTMVYQDGVSGKSYAKKFQIGGLSRDKLYPLAKSEKSKVLYVHVNTTEEGMPHALHVFLDGRSGARVRELEFDLTTLPVSSRSSLGRQVTKWTIKEVRAAKPKKE